MSQAAPTSSPGSSLPKVVPALTGIRGLAAVWVVLFHSGLTFGPLFPGVEKGRWLWGQGDAAVPLFYLLSGFILSHIYDPRSFRLEAGALATFWKHRLFRIYPLYLFTLGAYAATVWLNWPPPPERLPVYTGRQLLLNVCLVETFPLVRAVAWNVPSWTISVEWFAYLFAFPAGCLLQRGKHLDRRWWLAGVYFGVILASALLEGGFFHSNTRMTLQGCLLFSAGMLLHAYARAGGAPRGGGMAALLALAGCLVVFPLASHAHAYHYFVFISPLILLACLDPGSPVARFCSLPWVLFLGELSYSIYLGHAIVENLICGRVPPLALAGAAWPVRLGEILLFAAGTFAFSLLTYYGVEKPARRFLRARFG